MSYIDLTAYDQLEIDAMEEKWKLGASSNVKLFRVFNESSEEDYFIKAQDDFTVY